MSDPVDRDPEPEALHDRDFREQMALAGAAARDGHWARAAEGYELATRIRPDAEASYNLGVVRNKLGQADAAARALGEAWRLDPMFTAGPKGAMAVLARAVRDGYRWPSPAPLPLPPDPPHVSVIVCSIDDAKAAAIRGLYERLLAGISRDVRVIRDARSLAEAYHRGIAEARGEVLILSHDDIDILAEDFAARLLHHLASSDVVGVVGATRATGPVPVWAGHPYVRGWITHRAPGATTWDLNVLDPLPVAGGMAVLDGVLLAGRARVFASVPFDAVAFDGFHGYDVDWSVRAAQAGFRLAAAGDLRLVHASGGRYDATWQRYADRLRAKHRMGGVAAAPSPYYRIGMSEPEGVCAVLDGLMHIQQPGTRRA